MAKAGRKAKVKNKANTSIGGDSSLVNDFNQKLFYLIPIITVLLYIKSITQDYINFDDNWQEDFSVGIMISDLELFEVINFDDLKNKKVRVRGWLESYNGPYIQIFHPAHLEVLK